jgi:uncharacterized protein GlcG (DUF336 family)
VALTSEEVTSILREAQFASVRAAFRPHIAVVDLHGNILGQVRPLEAPPTSVVEGTLGQGLEGLALPADLVAVTKAGTGALLSSGGQAFSTRTAAFIVQEHFPPGIFGTSGGPLFGVQFSSLPCTDFKQPNLPFGLSADPGGLPLYKDGVLVGGIGVEGDGAYTVDRDPIDDDQHPEERVALEASLGFEAPAAVRADQILADGVRLPYANAPTTDRTGGQLTSIVTPVRAGLASTLVASTVGGVPGQADPRFPTRAGSALDAGEVQRILAQAAQQTVVTRAAIRQPLGSHARVSIAVVDVDGAVLGFFQNEDAPNFGIDVSVQKARTANFFSHPAAGAELTAAGLASYVRDVRLDGSIAFTSRAVGFLAQPTFPPGIDDTEPGPFSLPLSGGVWSPFNTGLQLDIVKGGILSGLLGRCNATLPRLPNGITIFPGGIPLYKNGVLAGAIGISGDGVDQDDLIAAAGSAGFEAAPERRSDTVIVRGVRLPYVKFPRHPEL